MAKTWAEGDEVTATLMNYFCEDTGWLTSSVSIAPGTNFTVSSFRLRRIGRRVTGNVVVTYTGSTITADSGGNFTDTTAFTFPAGWAVATTAGAQLEAVGVRQWFGRVDASGAKITHGLPSQSLTSGTAVTFWVDHYID